MLCIDESERGNAVGTKQYANQIQAGDRTLAMLPIRNGGATLFAYLDVTASAVIGTCTEPHQAWRFRIIFNKSEEHRARR